MVAKPHRRALDRVNRADVEASSTARIHSSELNDRDQLELFFGEGRSVPLQRTEV
jgi:hypothetical protein